MDAIAFHTVVTNYTALKPEEFGQVKEWSRHFPYCQVLHLVASRSAQDQKDADQQTYLHHAAVYATDRIVLKQVMTVSAKPRVEVIAVMEPKPEVQLKPEKAPEPEPIVKKKESTPPKEVAKPLGSLHEKNTLEGDALREDLNFQLHRLRELMHQFDDRYEELQGKVPKSSPVKNKVEAEAPKDGPLIEEIKSSRRKPKIVSPKVAEQGEIIDNFIKVAPTLPRTKPKDAGPDLSEDSVNYGDNIVSETLVDILLKQGKKGKAIEMLRKLIWKFPQKKAYFAAQIEALKD